MKIYPHSSQKIMCVRPRCNDRIGARMGGWKDRELWIAVQAEGRYLITADKGFADIRQFPPGTHAGVLLLRPDEDGIYPLLELMDYVLRQQPLEELSGLTTVATPKGLRIRRGFS